MTIYKYCVQNALYVIPVYIVMIVTKITSHPVGLNTHQQFQSRSHHYEHSFVGVANIDTNTVSPKIATIAKRNPALMRILKRQKSPTRESYILLRTAFKPSSPFMSFQKHFSGMNDIFRTFNLEQSPFIRSKNLPNQQIKTFIRQKSVSSMNKDTHHLPTDTNSKKIIDRFQIKDVHWYGPKLQKTDKMSQQTQRETSNKYILPLTTNRQSIGTKYYSEVKKSSPVDNQYYSEVKSAPVDKQYHTSVNNSPQSFTNTKQEQFASQGSSANSYGNSGMWKNRGTSGFVDRFTPKNNNDGYGVSRIQRPNKVIHHGSSNDMKHSGKIPNYTQKKEYNTKNSYLISGKKNVDIGYTEPTISKSANMANTQIQSHTKINSLDLSSNLNDHSQNDNNYGGDSRYFQHGRDDDVSIDHRRQSNQNSGITKRIQHQTVRRNGIENGMDSKQIQQSKQNVGGAEYVQQSIRSNDQGYDRAGRGIAQQTIQHDGQRHKVASSGIQELQQAESRLFNHQSNQNVVRNNMEESANNQFSRDSSSQTNYIQQKAQADGHAYGAINKQQLKQTGEQSDHMQQTTKTGDNHYGSIDLPQTTYIVDGSPGYIHQNRGSNYGNTNDGEQLSKPQFYTATNDGNAEYQRTPTQTGGATTSYALTNSEFLQAITGGTDAWYAPRNTQIDGNKYGPSNARISKTTETVKDIGYVRPTVNSAANSHGEQKSGLLEQYAENNFFMSDTKQSNAHSDSAGYSNEHQVIRPSALDAFENLQNSGGYDNLGPLKQQLGMSGSALNGNADGKTFGISQLSQNADTYSTDKLIDTENMQHQSSVNTEKNVDRTFGFSEGIVSYDSKQSKVIENGGQHQFQVQDSYGSSEFMGIENMNGKTELQSVKNLGQTSHSQQNLGQTSQVQESSVFKEHKVMHASNVHAPISTKQEDNGYITSKHSESTNDYGNSNFEHRIQSSMKAISKDDSSYKQINENSHNGAQMPGAVLKDIVESHEVKRIYGKAIEKVNPTGVYGTKRENVEPIGTYRQTENVNHSGNKYGFNIESTKATEVYSSRMEKFNPTGTNKAKLDKPKQSEVYRLNKNTVKPTVAENIVMKLSSPSTYTAEETNTNRLTSTGSLYQGQVFSAPTMASRY
ncbi:uncharacterized protein DDB_G0283357-like [Mytilus edulis]|uniref:uncharacterized protein DDB_G0283357-like n=1 Tax=Mytilus edulis TaxID=6550 RepID=UPI0039EE9A31